MPQWLQIRQERASRLPGAGSGITGATGLLGPGCLLLRVKDARELGIIEPHLSCLVIRVWQTDDTHSVVPSQAASPVPRAVGPFHPQHHVYPATARCPEGPLPLKLEGL